MQGSSLVAAFLGLKATGPVKASVLQIENDGDIKLSRVYVAPDGKPVAEFIANSAQDADKAFKALTKGKGFRANLAVVDDNGLVSKVSKPALGE